MLTSSDLKQVQIFSCLNGTDLQWLSQQTADIHLEPGGYLIHEGEPASFFVLLEGTTEVVSHIMGRRTEVSQHKTGDFFGDFRPRRYSCFPQNPPHELQQWSILAAKV